jgi:hypothetical protein
MNKTATFLVGVLACALCSAGTVALASATVGDTQEWDFTVYLDDSEIGFHRFQLTDMGERREVETEAEFRVKFLFFNAYRYTHENTETWAGDCLERIESRTDANGQPYSVLGLRAEDEFFVSSNETKMALPDCVMTFAYWDPRFLTQSRLLNTQTGEYLEVSVDFAGQEKIAVQDVTVAAYRYSLTAEDIDLDLWYSEDGKWLALESITEGGRKLRYELT